MRLNAPSPKRLLVHAAILVVAIAACTASLRHRANPWRPVLEIPGSDPGMVPSIIDGGHDLGATCLSDQTLAVGRPDAQVDLWDLKTLKHTSTIGAPRPASGGWNNNPNQVIYVAAAAKGYVALRGWSTFDLISPSGTSPLVDSDVYAGRGRSASPDGTKLAAASIDTVFVWDLTTKQLLHQFKLQYVNSGNRRLDWTPDSRYLLLNDHLGVRVWDLSTGGKLVYFHRELDLSLPAPMIADENSGIARYESVRSAASATRASRPNLLNAPSDPATDDLTTLVDSRFSPSGSTFATIYTGYGLFNNGPPTCQRLRLYDTATGNLLFDTVLPWTAISATFSPDGTLLYVMRECRNSYPIQPDIAVYDAKTGNLLRTVTLPPDLAFGVHPLDSSRFVATTGPLLCVVDTDNEYLTIRVDTAGHNLQVLATNDGKRIIASRIDGRVKIFDRARDPSQLGAFALPETWAIYFLCLVLCLGVPAAQAVATRRIDNDGRALGYARLPELGFPRALRVALLIGAVSLAWSVADTLVTFAADAVYVRPEQKSVGRHLWSWGVTALAFGSLVGVARLRRGWWKLRIVLVMIAIATMLFAVGVVALSAKAAQTIAAEPIIWHGVSLHFSPLSLLAFLMIYVTVPAVELYCLLRADVRRCFVKAAKALSSGHAFEVIQAPGGSTPSGET